jgi:hypothetical protein
LPDLPQIAVPATAFNAIIVGLSAMASYQALTLAAGLRERILARRRADEN